MIPVGFRALSDHRKLQLAATIESGRPALLRFRLIGPTLFSTGYSYDPTGAWCLIRFATGVRYSAFCPGGAEWCALLQDALCNRAERCALDAWARHEAALFRRPGSRYLPNRTLRQYFAGRKFMLPVSTVSAAVVVRQSLIIRRFGNRYYHYISLSPTTLATAEHADGPVSCDPDV